MYRKYLFIYIFLFYILIIYSDNIDIYLSISFYIYSFSSICLFIYLYIHSFNHLFIFFFPRPSQTILGPGHCRPFFIDRYRPLLLDHCRPFFLDPCRRFFPGHCRLLFPDPNDRSSLTSTDHSSHRPYHKHHYHANLTCPDPLSSSEINFNILYEGLISVWEIYLVTFVLRFFFRWIIYKDYEG